MFECLKLQTGSAASSPGCDSHLTPSHPHRLTDVTVRYTSNLNMTSTWFIETFPASYAGYVRMEQRGKIDNQLRKT